MELHQVRYFIALCQSLNFTRAAEACNVTQPALTRAIQRLEEELGGPLVQRERNLTQLTELGRLMRPWLEQSLAAAEAAKEQATRFRKSEVAALRLGFEHSISARVVAGALAELTRRIPAVEIEMTAGPQESVVESVLQGELDAALLLGGDALPDRLNKWPLFAEGYQVAFAAEHRFAALAAVPAAALDSEIMVERRGCEAARRLRERRNANGAPPGLRHVADTLEQMGYLAAKTSGVALLPAHLAPPAALAARPLAEPPLRRSIVLAVASGRRYSPALDAFLKLSRARDLAAELGVA